MPTDVIMPKVDMVMDAGTIVRWYRQEHEAVRAGEPLLEIETDKSTIDVEAPASGVLAAISAHPGDTVPVAVRIALILAPGEEVEGNRGTGEQGNRGTGPDSRAAGPGSSGTGAPGNRGTAPDSRAAGPGSSGTGEPGNSGTGPDSRAAGPGNRGTGPDSRAAGAGNSGTGPDSRAAGPGNSGTGEPGNSGTGPDSRAAGPGNSGTGEPGNSGTGPDSRAAGPGNSGTGPDSRAAGQPDRAGQPDSRTGEPGWTAGQPEGVARSSADPRPRATPAARAVARQHGLDLWQVAGSGPRGRVRKGDVLARVERQAAGARSQQAEGQATAGAIGAQASSPGAEVPPLPGADLAQAEAAPALNGARGPVAEGELVPLSGVRRVIAERLSASAAIPQFTLSVDVDMRAALELRERLVYRPSLTALIARAVAGLLTRHPTLNASFRPDGLWLHRPVHLGIAMDVATRLLVPVVRDAERRGLNDIHTTIASLRERATARQLGPAELQGSTFSISNLGMYGVDMFTALINPPEAAILAVGQVSERVVGVGGTPQVRPMLTLTLSVDHRAADGAAAARFLGELRAALAEPYLML